MKTMKTLWVSMLSLGFLCGCSKPVTYKVSWWNGDDLLTTTQVKKGEMPVYEGETPTKVDATGEYEYTFDGWSPEVVEAVEDASYTAEFKEERVNWSVEEKALMMEHLFEVLPYFEEDLESPWEYDEDYDCISAESPLEVSVIEKVFTDNGYTLDFEDLEDPELMMATVYKDVGEEGEFISVDIWGNETFTEVDAYYNVPAKEPETLEEVMQDIAAAFWEVEEPVLGTDYRSDGEGGFFTAASFGAGDESKLPSLFSYCAYYIPEYMGDPVVGPKSTTLSGGIPAYYANWLSANGKAVQLLCYVNGGKIYAQFSVFTPAAE